jgi:8-oxo-dGTP pyrophosphatase MutT (NUDIX family)
MKGKTPSEAAAQEAFEEAGVRGTMALEPVGRYAYNKVSLDGSSTLCFVDVYPLRVDQELEEWKELGARTRSWAPLETASMLAYEEGLSDLLATLDHNILIGTVSVARRKKMAKKSGSR